MPGDARVSCESSAKGSVVYRVAWTHRSVDWLCLEMMALEGLRQTKPEGDRTGQDRTGQDRTGQDETRMEAGYEDKIEL
ncbi:hypothetical protein LY78DRAFT_653948, partial [Colletotrichum sublineola]